MTDKTPPKPESFGEIKEEPMDSDEFKYEKTKVDENSAKERLGRDIYTDETQAFEEMHSNGVTAIHEAADRGFIDIDEGVIEIELMKNEDGNVCMRLRDNGIGMNEETVRNVFLDFGVTTGAQKEDVVAQFGMGVASYSNLVGFHDGKIYMETNPRYEEEALYGYYSIDGLQYNVDETELRLLSEDEYGTAYEMWLREDISSSDVRSWIERVSNYNDVRIKIDYQDGHSETIEPSTVYDKFNQEDSLFVEHEDMEIGKFVAGHNVPSDTVLIHRDIEFNLDSDNRPPFKDNVFIRLYTESEKVCEGEHKGKLVIDDSKYQQLDEEMKERHIPRSEVSDQTAVTPRVVGNREKLSSDGEFSRWVVEKLREAYYNRAKNCLEQINSADDFYSMNRKSQNFVELVMSKNIFSYSYKYNNFSDRMEDKYTENNTEGILEKFTPEDYTVNSNTVRILSALFDTSAIKDSIGLSDNRPEIGWSIEQDRRNGNTTVYMGVSINDKKKRVVREDDPNSIIIRVDNAGVYDRYEEVFGWDKLKTVKKSNLDEYNISQETKNLFKSKTKSVDGDTNTTAETLTIHYGRRKHKKKKMTASYVKESLENDNPGDLYGTPIVAFPESTSHNISNYYGFAKKNSGLFNCTTETWESLKQFDEVKHIEEIIKEHKSTTEVSTESENTNVEKALRSKNYIVVVTKPEYLNQYRDIFGDTELCKRFKAVLANGKLGSRKINVKKVPSREVMLITKTKLQDNHFLFKNLSYDGLYHINKAQVRGEFGEATKLSRKNQHKIIARLMLIEWVDEKVYDEITQTISSYSDPLNLVSNVRKALENKNLQEDELQPDELEYNL